MAVRLSTFMLAALIIVEALLLAYIDRLFLEGLSVRGYGDDVLNLGGGPGGDLFGSGDAFDTAPPVEAALPKGPKLRDITKMKEAARLIWMGGLLSTIGMSFVLITVCGCCSHRWSMSVASGQWHAFVALAVTSLALFVHYSQVDLDVLAQPGGPCAPDSIFGLAYCGEAMVLTETSRGFTLAMFAGGIVGAVFAFLATQFCCPARYQVANAPSKQEAKQLQKKKAK